MRTFGIFVALLNYVVAVIGIAAHNWAALVSLSFAIAVTVELAIERGSRNE